MTDTHDRKAPDEFTVDDWRGAFDALTELYNAEVKRADDAERWAENLRESFVGAVETSMKLSSTYGDKTIARLERELAEMTAERDRLRSVVAAVKTNHPSK